MLKIKNMKERNTIKCEVCLGVGHYMGQFSFYARNKLFYKSVLFNIPCDLCSLLDIYLRDLKHCLTLIISSTENNFKSPSPGLTFLPDSGPAYIHVDEPEESIINQLLVVSYCLQSPATLVFLMRKITL